MIETRNLGKRFGSRVAVDDLSFQVATGEVLGFLGPNGAGKSTTMKMLTGFLAPSAGTASIFGFDIRNRTLQAQRLIGYLPEGSPCYAEMTVQGFLDFIAEIRGYRGAGKRERVARALGLLELDEVRRQTIETLSKGFRRRVGLAQAILHEPRALVLDEPTDGLDPNQKHQVRELIRGLAQERIVIISTHILEEISALCSRALVIGGGRLLADSTPLELASQVAASRDAIRAILDGDDPRLLVVVGPCSIHDPRSALEYAERLAALSDELDGQLLLVMRAYVEKPRTTVGWKGLAYDPHLDGSDDMAAGLALSRQLMLDMLRLGLPLATELLQPLAAGYFDDLLSWAAIGARTSESQIHRELVSGLGLPVGFKNGTDGGVGIACDAIRSAAHGHRHFGLDPHGHPALIETRGNPDTHVVLRGGRHGSNYGPEQVQAVRQALESQGIATRMMVDCSHANSGKNPLNQPGVLASVLDQRLAGASDLVGVMLESHLFDGCQALGGELRYGVSITDGCLGWEGTERILRDAARRLAERR